MRNPNLLAALAAIALQVGCSSGDGQGGGADRLKLVDPSLQSYQPTSVAVPEGAGYVRPDGSLTIAGFDDVSGIFAEATSLFTKAHPEIRFTLELQGTGTGIHRLMYDSTLLAPVGEHGVILQTLPYEWTVGSKEGPAPPLAIRVAHASLSPAGKLSPLGVIVHPGNPIASLTTEQVAAIFSAGQPDGDITAWRQLGLEGELANHAIRPIGLWEDPYLRPEDPSMGEYMVYRKMGGRPFRSNYERFTRYDDVVSRVSGDPSAIGLVALNRVTKDVKVVPLATADSAASSGGAADIVAGSYPFDRYIYVYIRRVPDGAFDNVRRAPGAPLDPVAAEFTRLLLSKEGQRAIAGDGKGYLPLNANEITEELERLDRAAVEWKARGFKAKRNLLENPVP